jgi:hypothetical protein
MFVYYTCRMYRGDACDTIDSFVSAPANECQQGAPGEDDFQVKCSGEL